MNNAKYKYIWVKLEGKNNKNHSDKSHLSACKIQKSIKSASRLIWGEENERN